MDNLKSTALAFNAALLNGQIEAQGKTVKTAFSEAFECGGVFLSDEMDESSQFMDFPDAIVLNLYQ